MTTYQIEPIGWLKSCFPDKFGIPRQGKLTPHSTATIHMTKPFANADWLRGLTQYQYIWLIFVFHLHPENHFKALVRPPRLGGQRKIGVFASRAPFRPNRLGLSLVELCKIDDQPSTVLHIKGHDLVEGTPIIDIKPYLPWADNAIQTTDHWAAQAPETVKVDFSAKAHQQLMQQINAMALKKMIKEVLALNPKPNYHPLQNEGTYAIRLAHLNIRYRIKKMAEEIYIEVEMIELWPAN